MRKIFSVFVVSLFMFACATVNRAPNDISAAAKPTVGAGTKITFNDTFTFENSTDTKTTVVAKAPNDDKCEFSMEVASHSKYKLLKGEALTFSSVTTKSEYVEQVYTRFQVYTFTGPAGKKVLLTCYQNASLEVEHLKKAWSKREYTLSSYRLINQIEVTNPEFHVEHINYQQTEEPSGSAIDL